MFKLLIILILMTLLFARKDRVQIAFLSSPGNFEVIPSFVKLAEFLSIIKGYGCVSIVHSADRNAWDRSPCAKIKYGESQGDEYLEKLFSAQNTFEEKYLLSADAFKEPFEMLINAFYQSKAFFELKRLDIDILVCDSSNLLCNIVAEKLEVQRKVYHSSTVPSPDWVDYFESSASHHPVMISPYTNLMGGWQRFRNYVNHYLVAHGIRAQRKLFVEILKAKEDEKVHFDKFFDYNALFTTQAIRGFNYPLYLPPNVANLGCVSCIMPHQVPLELDKFLGKYSQNVYVKIERINSPDFLKHVFDAIEEFKKIGFIIRADLPKGIKLPTNLYRIDYVPTVDILANSKVHAIIHDGDWASIVESVYYRKPMIALTYRYDTRANGALIEDRGVGICFTKESEITKMHIANSLKTILDPKSSYAEAILKYSKIAVGLNTTRQVEKWFDNYLRNGVDHLVVKPFYEMSFISYYNLDVWFVCLGLPALLMFILSAFLAKQVRKAKGKKVVGKSQSQSKDQKQSKETEIQKEKTD